MRRDSTFATSRFPRKRTNHTKIQIKPKEIDGLSATTSDTSRPPPASSTTRSRPGAQDAPRWVHTRSRAAKTGDEVQIHGQSTLATVIAPQPEQCHQIRVRWNTRMREQSIIDLTEIASVKPRQSKRPRVSATNAGAGPTAHDRISLTADDHSASATTSQADPAAEGWTSSTTGGSAASTADGHTDLTASARGTGSAANVLRPDVVGAIAGVATVCCRFRLSNAPRASLEAECEARSIVPDPQLRRVGLAQLLCPALPARCSRHAKANSATSHSVSQGGRKKKKEGDGGDGDKAAPRKRASAAGGDGAARKRARSDGDKAAGGDKAGGGGGYKSQKKKDEEEEAARAEDMKSIKVARDDL